MLQFKFSFIASLFYFIIISGNINAIPLGLLYNTTNEADVHYLPQENDISSQEIKLDVPIVFYGVPYDTIFVNSNGFLSFQVEIPYFINMEFPLDYPIIAPFYSNVDTRRAGTISYFQSRDPVLLDRINLNVHESFLDSVNFQTTNLFVVSWIGVGYYNLGYKQTNTYQVAIATNGIQTYVELLYPDNSIQWIQGTGDDSGLPDAKAQVGFLSADGKVHVLPGSGTEQVRHLPEWSNVGLVGQYIFRVDKREIIEPDAFRNSPASQSIQTCSDAPAACHSQAKCIDYDEGFCCQCNPDQFGNGKFCINNTQPIRANGKVNGVLNGEKLDNLDLQSYIVTENGRTYTAISKIPTSIGADIQTMQILGSVIGYIFAKPVRGALNGFQLTGGQFNYSAIVTFPRDNKEVRIHAKFLGIDVFEHLKIEVNVDGSIPTIPPDAKVDISNEYQEQYTQTNDGTIQMSSERSYTLSSPSFGQTVNNFKVEQTFNFNYCPYKRNSSAGESWTLKVGANFISFEAREQIIRFGMNSKVSPIGEYDPCEEGRVNCGPHSSCVVEGNSYECLCNPGYQRIYSGSRSGCVDINECQTGVHECDDNSQCINDIGSHHCICNPGFELSGRVCVPVKTCDNVTCPENAACEQYGDFAGCKCLPGFRGDGLYCEPSQSQGCDVSNNCSPYGYCSIDSHTNEYSCYCINGFYGDGYTCNPIVTTTPAESTFIETTTYYGGTSADDCRKQNYCDRNAQCSQYGTDEYICTCNSGYEGDGVKCYPKDDSCTTSENCDIHASCSYSDDLGKSKCVCNYGYFGDGHKCVALGTSAVGTCTSNADCAPTEECQFQTDRYECVCKVSYIRDSQYICVPDKGVCGGADCAENAECLFDDTYQTQYCACQAGFVGDGITECKIKPAGCDVLNNCGLHAVCQYEQQPDMYVCRCNPGYFGDGFNCYLEKNCLIEPSMCHSNALCYADSQRRYICQCKAGYVGNGTVCKEIVKSTGNFLLLNQGMATLRIPIEQTRSDLGKPIQIKSYQTAVGLDIDCLEGRLYWGDITGKAIRSSLYNGSDKAEVVTNSIDSPEGLAIDHLSRNLYWTDSTLHTIEVLNLDSRRRKRLFDTKLVNPRGIAVHPQRGKIFWTDWDRAHPKIEWANADGTDRKILLEGPVVSLPNSLAIDYDTEQLCYADAGTHKIECIQIDTHQRHVIAANCSYPFGISITDSVIYWSDWITKKIERIDKQTLTRLPPLKVPVGGTGNKLFGLVAVPEHCPELANVCQYYKCPEEYICLPDGKGSKRCVCAASADGNKVPNCENEWDHFDPNLSPIINRE